MKTLKLIVALFCATSIVACKTDKKVVVEEDIVIEQQVVSSTKTYAELSISEGERGQKEYTIENCVNTFSKEEAIPTKVGYQYWFADKNFLDGRTLKMSAVAPGKATHPPHKHLEDEFFFVLEGTAKFHLNGKEVIVAANTSLYCPSYSMHGISNAGDTELKYLVIKKYETK